MEILRFIFNPEQLAVRKLHEGFISISIDWWILVLPQLVTWSLLVPSPPRLRLLLIELSFLIPSSLLDTNGSQTYILVMV